MIVRRTWVSTSVNTWYTRVNPSGDIYYKCIRTWRGYFLLGIIPLYIKTINVSYR